MHLRLSKLLSRGLIKTSAGFLEEIGEVPRTKISSQLASTRYQPLSMAKGISNHYRELEQFTQKVFCQTQSTKR